MSWFLSILKKVPQQPAAALYFIISIQFIDLNIKKIIHLQRRFRLAA
jgi:hypothetical protein